MTDSTRLHDEFEFLLAFRILPIKHIQVKIEHEGIVWTFYHWTKADRVAIAQIIREKISDVEGVKAHNREIQLLRERNPAQKAEESEH